MSFLFLTVDSITVNDAGDDGGFRPFDTDSEWRLDVSAHSNLFNYSTNFSNNDVSDGDVLDAHDGAWVFLMSPGENIVLDVSGYEADTVFDDPLPGISGLELDPTTIGQDYSLTLGDSDYSYTINLDAVFA